MKFSPKSHHSSYKILFWTFFKRFCVYFKMQEVKDFERFSICFRKFYDQQAISILADGLTFCWQDKRNLEALILSYIAYSTKISNPWKLQLLLKCTKPCDNVWYEFTLFCAKLRRDGLRVIPRLIGPFFWQTLSYIWPLADYYWRLSGRCFS